MNSTEARIIQGYDGANAASAAILLIMGAENPYLLLGEMVFYLIGALGGVNPLEKLMEAFSGRPTMEATIDEAKVFNRYSTPVAKLLATGAADLVHRGIPVSSPHAAPIFGPYFGAAQRVENAIRFGDFSTQHTELTNATLSAAMHEAGNPGRAGTETLVALQQAYNRFAEGDPMPGAAAYQAVLELAGQTGGAPSTVMSKGWATEFIANHPSHFPHVPPGGQKPGPPPIPPPPKPGPGAQPPPGPPPKAPHAGITLDHQWGQTVRGAITVRATLNQYDRTEYPHATLHWYLDGLQLGTGHAIGIITTQHPDGNHQLDIKLIGQRGEVHDELAIDLVFDNVPEHPKPPQKPPIPPPLPTGNGDNPPLPIPPVEIPGQEQFNLCCAELLAMLFQLVEQVYFIGKHLPAEANAIDDLSTQVNAVAHQVAAVNQELAGIYQHMPTSGDAMAIAHAVQCVCDALKGSGDSGFGEIVKQLTRIADEQKRGDDQYTASKELLDLLVKQGLLDQETRSLFQSGASAGVLIGEHLPVIWKWLNDPGTSLSENAQDFANAIVRGLKGLLHWIENETEPFFAHVVHGAVKLGKDLEAVFPTVFNELASLDTALPRMVFEKVVDTVFQHGAPTPDNVEDIALKLHGAAFLVGQGVHVLSELAGFLKYPASSVWKGNAELMIEMLAYEEILKSFHQPFFAIAITERAKQRFNRQYHPHIPVAAMAHQGFARDKINAAGRDAILGLNGRDPAYHTFEQSLAYRPISPRLLANGFRNHAPDPHLLDELITDSSVEPRFHDLMVQIIDDACYRHINDQYASTALAAADAGAMTLDELDDHLRASNWDDKARGIARQIALISRQKIIAQQTEQAATTELSGGAITEDQARGLLQAGGVDDWRIETTVAIGNARAALSEARRLQNEEQRLLRKAFSEEQAAYEQQYLAGNLDELGLTAALAIALESYLGQYAGFGATPEEIATAEQFGKIELAALVTKLQAKKQGSLVLRYGKHMTRADAQLLDVRVAEVKEAYLKSDLNDQQATARLEGLDIDKKYIRALVQRWAQQIAKKGSHPLPDL